jgi:hypothetical protein
MISKIVKGLIEDKFGHPIKYSRDCEALAADVSEKCKCKISATTIRRVFGVVKTKQTPREYTLDLLAQYAGYSDYEKLITSLNRVEYTEDNSITEVISEKIKKSVKFEITYSPDCIVSILYLGGKHYKVLKSNSSLLLEGDIIQLNYFTLHFPLFILTIERKGVLIGKLTTAKISGITSIKKLD